METANDEDIITEGKYIIIRRTFDKNSYKLVKIGSEKFCFMGKQKISIASLKGQKFGSTFELMTNDRTLKLVNFHDYVLSRKTDSSEPKDNRFLTDKNSSQKLSRDDIEKIKKEVSGQEIVKTLVENSATFENKNKFSQQKYLAKKQKKYVNLYTVLKPNIKFLMEMYYAKGPVKNGCLRTDSLSQLLTLCNVMAGGDYMVVDSNLGILSAALMERTGGQGHIVQVHVETIPSGSSRQAVQALNYPQSTVAGCLLSLSLDDVCRIDLEKKKKTEDGEVTAEVGGDVGAAQPSISTKKELRLQEVSRAQELLRGREMHGLLMLTKEHDPGSIADILLEYLGLSRPFVIFSASIEPLKACFAQLKRKCLYLRLSETFLRKYQVLDDRTRPDMVMAASSGFILSGIKAEM